METPANYDAGTDGTLQVRDARTERRFFVDNVIIRGYGPALGVYGVAVYSALCMHAKLATQQGYPSHSTIAELLDCSASKVKGSIRLLEKLKLIHSEPRYDKKTHRQTSNLYTLLAPPVPPVITDTPPRNAEKATNNPPLDQSYLNKEPPLADSPPVEDSYLAAVHSLPPPESTTDDPDSPSTNDLYRRDITETEAMFKAPTASQEAAEKILPRLRDKFGVQPRENVALPVEIAAVVEKARAEAVHPDMGDPTKDADSWMGGPVREWCAFIRIPYEEQSLSRKAMWARDLREIATGDGLGKTPRLTGEAIRIMTLSPSCQWLRTASRPTHREFAGVLLNVLCGQQLPDGKANGGASGGRNETPQVDQAVKATMARLFDETGRRINRG